MMQVIVVFLVLMLHLIVVCCFILAHCCVSMWLDEPWFQVCGFSFCQDVLFHNIIQSKTEREVINRQSTAILATFLMTLTVT